MPQAQLVHDAGTEALDDGIGRFDQPQEKRPPGRLLEIKAQAFLVAIHDLIEITGLTRHRPHAAGVIPGTGVLDLDDLGAVVGKMLRGQGPGKQSGEVEDSQTGQGLG
ncbi:hypothetical protein SDC9_177859 [bioreactor metagenome]|uniref:Uncharacterized protein n=1 Tax=bioreactor metagenome TaxID=1076179 RepID=A0A645GU73_9ZZZZ